MRNFLKAFENDFKVINIEEQISTRYEVSKILKKHDKEVVIFNNIKESDYGYNIWYLQHKGKNSTFNIYNRTRNHFKDN